MEVWKRGCYLCKVRQVAKAGLKVILAAPFYLDLPGPTHDWARYYIVRPLSFKGQALRAQGAECSGVLCEGLQCNGFHCLFKLCAFFIIRKGFTNSG